MIFVDCAKNITFHEKSVKFLFTFHYRFCYDTDKQSAGQSICVLRMKHFTRRRI